MPDSEFDSPSNDDDLMLPQRFSAPHTAVTHLRRIFYRKTTNSPFISGDSFAEIVDYAPFGFDGQSRPDEKELLKARSLFIPADLLDELEQVGDRLNIRPKVVITGNSDRNFVTARRNPFDCDLWLCQNNAMPPREGLMPLPIGLENKRLGRLGLEKWYKFKKDASRKRIVLVPPMRPTNPKRGKAIREALAQGEPFWVERRYLSASSYFKLLRGFQFALCLEGNGFENCRIWECLYLGIFPVVMRSPFSENLSGLRLPILLVDSLQQVNSELLNNFAEMNCDYDPRSVDQLWIPYWKNMIWTATGKKTCA